MTKDEQEALREKLVAEKTQDLMSEEFYPFSTKNFTEALQNFPDASYSALSTFASMAQAKFPSDNLAKAILADALLCHARDYWLPLANDEAERLVPCDGEIE